MISRIKTTTVKENEKFYYIRNNTTPYKTTQR